MRDRDRVEEEEEEGRPTHKGWGRANVQKNKRSVEKRRMSLSVRNGI
jgi:hypothetical protein